MQDRMFQIIQEELDMKNLGLALLASFALLSSGCFIGERNLRNLEQNGGENGGTGGTQGPGNIVEVAASAGNFTELLNAAITAGLAETLSTGEFTVFAPTDAAFQSLLANLQTPPTVAELRKILLYHVVPGRVPASAVVSSSNALTVAGARVGITLNGNAPILNGTTNVIQTDIQASNGIIHVIDQVLIPPQTAVEIAISSAPEFTILVGIVVELGLAQVLNSYNNLTIFAPTNAAFNALGITNLTDLIAAVGDINAARNVILDHLLPNELLAEQITNGSFSTAISGRNLPFTVVNGVVHINAQSPTQAPVDVVLANIYADRQSVVHVINNVILL